MPSFGDKAFVPLIFHFGARKWSFLSFIVGFRQRKHRWLFAVNVSFRGNEIGNTRFFVGCHRFKQPKHLLDCLSPVNVSFRGKEIGNTRYFNGFRQRKQIAVQIFSINISFRATEMWSFYQICCFLSRKIFCLGELLIMNAVSHIDERFIFSFLGKKSRTLQTICRTMAPLSPRSVFTLRQNVHVMFMFDVSFFIFSLLRIFTQLLYCYNCCGFIQVPVGQNASSSVWRWKQTRWSL